MSRFRHEVRLLTLLLGGLAVLSILPGVLASSPRTTPAQGTRIDIINSSVLQSTVGEADDYATLVWGDPWDMSDSLDVRQLDSPKCAHPNHFNEIQCPAGIWGGQVRLDVGNPDLFLLHPGYSGALSVGRMGSLGKINANYYTQLTFRMYIDAIDANDPGWQVLWTNGTVAEINPNTPNRYGESHLFKSYPGWNIYTVDLSIYANGTPSYAISKLPWSGQLTGLRLDPGLCNMNGKVVKLDWVRLTPAQSTPILWQTNETSDITIKLQSSDGIGTDDQLRVYEVNGDNTSPLNIPASQCQYTMPISLPPGQWYVKLEAGSAESVPVGPLQIQAAPIIRVVTPSRTSGQDYAETELKDPWDMNNSADIHDCAHITAPTFSGGIMSATSIDTNPQNSCPPSVVWENPNVKMVDDDYWTPPGTTDPPINTSKYRYFSFRLKVDRAPDISHGGIARVVWTDFLAENRGVSNDIPLHAGWNEVAIDLWDPNVLDTPDLSPWQASAQRRNVRLDPFEIPVATTFHIDWIKLTAVDQADYVYDIRWEVNDPDSTGLTTNIWYSTEGPGTEKASASSKVLIATIQPNGRAVSPSNPSPTSDSPGQTGNYTTYLPLVNSSYVPLPPCTGSCFRWDTSRVPEGTYYIYIEANDGYNTTTWCSEAPVVIKH